MKRLLYLTIFALSIGFISSCDNDEEPPASIVGKWQADKADFSITPSGIPVPIQHSEDDFDAAMEFNSDGTVSINDSGQTTSGTYEVKDKKLVTNVNFDTEIIDLSGEYTIKELTRTKLILVIEKDATVQDPDTGTTYSGTVKATLYFDRV